jgi:hypothetical protein
MNKIKTTRKKANLKKQFLHNHLRGNYMKSFTKAALASAISASLFTGTAFAEEKSLVEALADGKASVNLRFRVEDVDVEGTDGATATTLRTRLNYATGSYNGFSGFIEFDQVSEIFEVDYNTGPGGASFPGKAAVADPEGTDLNQSYIQYKNGGSTVKYGRQRILLDNQRFVGGVGWRQNEQTYDALSYSNTSVENLKLFGAYVYNVNRIFGDDRSPAGDNPTSTYLLNANYKFADVGSLTAYAYLLDHEVLTHFSTNTYGLRFAGSKSGFSYSVDYASQSDAGDNAADYSASFMAVEGGYNFKPVNVKAGYQVLGADGEDGYFVTPLATLHAFQGWSDAFLNGGRGNIMGGIQDIYASIGGKFGPVAVSGVYHQYSSDDSDASGMDDLGSEIGFVVKGKAGPVGLLAKYADYSADDFGADTSKLWLMATLSF